MVELLEVEGKQQKLSHICLGVHRYAPSFQYLLNLLNELLGEVSLFMILDRGAGRSEYLFIGNGLQGECSVVGRNEDAVPETTLDAALSEEEGAAWIVA